MIEYLWEGFQISFMIYSSWKLYRLRYIEDSVKTAHRGLKEAYDSHQTMSRKISRVISKNSLDS